VERIQQLLAGDRRALARLITLVEKGGPSAHQTLAALHPHTGQAHIVGVTGAPGTGKSTLVNALTQHLRAQQRTVGIVAVDPTSPFSGGAVLGDRVRMRDLAGDAGVFIRSMATRGSLGGLAASTTDVVKVLDAAGFDLVLVETVGAGQSEVEIARTAHTTLVLEAPGLGDEVQTMKAGLLEIADILVVNKADRPGAMQATRALKAMLELDQREERGWQPPVLQTAALDGSGVAEVLKAIDAHRLYLQQSGLWRSKEREWTRRNLLRTLQEELLQRLLEQLGEETLEQWGERVVRKEMDARTAARHIVDLARCGADAPVNTPDE